MDVELTQSSQVVNVVTNSQSVISGDIKDSQNDEVNIQQVNSVNGNLANADTVNENGKQPEDVSSALDEVSQFVQSQNRNLNFSYDEQSNRSVVKVTDSETGELIRQIPSEEVLQLSERIRDLQTDVGSAVGVLFNKEV